MLEYPLHDGFFPQISLSRDELKYYKRLGKERVTQLIRIIEDADCAYKWTNVETPRTRTRLPGRARLTLDKDESTTCQRANFLDFQPINKSAHASTLLKASVQLNDTKVDEILRAVAKIKTKEFRKTMSYMHDNAFVDGRVLFTFPHESRSGNARTTRTSYRAIKWHALKSQRSRHGVDHKLLDFCYLEYSGKKKPRPGSNVVGFCVQESISRDREVPTLENFGIARGYLSRIGIIISCTHQPNTYQVTSLCQIDGNLNPIVRGVLEEVMQKSICTISRIAGLIARQRVSSLRFVEQWQWVPNSDRKACAVCLRGFYFRRKHHCRTCGEVVCSSCALLRELEEPIFDITHLRVCSACMTSASAQHQQFPTLSTETGMNVTSSTSNDTESYMRGLRSPQHNSYEEMVFQMHESHDRDRRQSDLALETPVETELKPSKPSLVRTQDKVEALTDVVAHIRKVRDTINRTMSEAASKKLENSEDVDELNDVYSEITSIREALESSVSNFDAALANATNAAPPLYYSGRSERSEGSQRGRENEMTPDQFNSVARITLAAARATRQAGQAFLSVGERQPELGDAASASSASIASYPTIYDSDSSTQSPDPYSESNYEKLMASYQPEHEGSEPEEDDQHTTHKFAESVRQASEIYELEKKIRELQRSLDEAHRKLSVIDSDEPEPEVRARQRLEDARERSARMEIESVFEIFGEREDDRLSLLEASSPRTKSSSKGTQVATQALVSELRGVMASSETPVRTNNGSRKSVSLPIQEKQSISPTSKVWSSHKLKSPLHSSPIVDEDFDSSSEDESSDDSSDDLSLLPKQQGPDAFFIEEDLGALLKKREAMEAGESPPHQPTDSPVSPPIETDKRNELRQLMAGLRPRSSSLPFHTIQLGGASSGESLNENGAPSWSDDAPNRILTVHQMDETVRALRACLQTFRCECPSDTERTRKLTSIFKVFRSLHREGVRSKFRTLLHDDIRYSKMLKTTPSIIKLFQLAGYVSQQEKLTMRRVDPDYLALFLQELEEELQVTTKP